MGCDICKNELEISSYQITRLTQDYGEIIESMDLCGICAQVIRARPDIMEFVER
jgi:hypothetical protein